MNYKIFKLKFFTYTKEFIDILNLSHILNRIKADNLIHNCRKLLLFICNKC